MNLNSKHLVTGSPCPASPAKDMFRIYSMRLCPYAQRVLLVAEAKKFPHEIVNCNLKQKPEFLFEKNAAGKVPVLEFADGRILTESLIISDYLDEIEAETKRKLHSPDILRKAQDRMHIDRFNSVIRSYYSIVYAPDDSQLQSVFDKLNRQLPRWEDVLGGRGSRFFGGNEKPGMLDYMIWPWMERLPILGMFHPTYFDFEKVFSDLPKLHDWIEDMKKDETVSKIFLTPQVHFQYTSSSKAGNPNYDIVLLQSQL